jgi:hypothetical protein
MTRTEAHHYLAIPVDYCRWLGGLRWCSNGEAIEHVAPVASIGCTFAMAGEIALFLEGYASGGPLISFGFILHLLQLLGSGVQGPNPQERLERFVDLAEALRETGRPIRNAGALCAMLCRDMPHSASLPDLTELGLTLRFPVAIPFYQRHSGRPAEVPPLEPAEFEAAVLRRLEGLSPEDVRHWLRFGRGPVAGAGEAVARAWTHDFGAILTGLGQRPRLAGAVPLVERLSGALALPPRRLAHAELPTGGYADITTRGRPEHLLPAQFALDDLEFLRRFAERELLYFHREEPRAPTAEELVIVLDCGVRTWGDVRLVLTAAALALVRRAARLGTPSRLTSTGHVGRSVEPDKVDPDSLGALLEASDLSPHPGAALECMLEETAAGRPRDLVLLTHPRNLREPEVAAAARRLAAGTRLFAITVDAGGCVVLAELRGGAPVALGRCRVAVEGPHPNPSVAGVCPGPSPWRGDVESIPFPFQLGVLGPMQDDRFDLDAAGHWLLAAGSPHGSLHAWRTDGTAAEMLPRASVDGRVVSWIKAVLGVAGGFVVSGWNGAQFIVAHYDFSVRVCTAHAFNAGRKPGPWWYLPHLHAIVARDANGRHHALDLGASKEEAARSWRAAAAHREAAAGNVPAPQIVPTGDPMPEGRHAVRLDPVSGVISIGFEHCQRAGTPRFDGEPMLEGGRIVQAQSAGNVIAVLVRKPRQSILVVYASHSTAQIDSLFFPPGAGSFRLSRDGRLIVHTAGERRLQVREVGGGPIPRLTTAVGKSHSMLGVALGASFLTVTVGKHAHLIRWKNNRLELSRNEEGDPGKLLAREYGDRNVTRFPAKGRPKTAMLWRRFVAGCTSYGLTVLVDVFGQIAVLDRDRRLICMFFVFRDQVAAWMPDGTRIGPVSILGGPPTAGGLERIGAALAAVRSPKRA